ncbi:MAG TPA: hypothetical protein VF469_27520, partial [Kofleriaceae bacterium]
LASAPGSLGVPDALAGAAAASSGTAPSAVGFCFRAYARVGPREILDTLGVRFALAMLSRCHVNAPWRK